jgi:hypothetical protein
MQLRKGIPYIESLLSGIGHHTGCRFLFSTENQTVLGYDFLRIKNRRLVDEIHKIAKDWISAINRIF